MLDKKMSKRQNSFRDDFQKEFKNIKRSLKGVHFAHCNVCDCEIKLEAIGKTAISLHNATQKHKKCARMIDSNQSVKTFFARPSQPTTTYYKAAAAEGAWAYHTIKNHQSFHSNSCASQLFKAIFPDSDVAKKFASARTKVTNIVTGVLAPCAKNKLLSDLGTQPFSILVDASNHKEVKPFPLVIRFFRAKVGVKVCLLDLRSMPGETSEQIMHFILSSMEENELNLQLLTSFCADNALVNFGGSNLGRKNNVFYHLAERKACLIPVGCPAHILHNAAEKGAERLTIGIKQLC